MTVPVCVGVEWINNFHPGPCNQNNLSYRDDHAEGFYDHMGSHGHFRIFHWGDDNAWETDIRHPDFGGGGDALHWSEDVDFFYYSDHGGNWSNVMHVAFAVSHNNCLGSSNTWKLGSRMMKWFVLDCCQAVLNTSASHICAVWIPPMRGLHMVFGFIGDGHDSWWNAGLGRDFGDDAGTGHRLANAWLDRAYSWWLDDNPIAIAAGASQAEAINRRENESVNWLNSPVSSTNWLAWKYRT
jgi:hypothetical protein